MYILAAQRDSDQGGSTYRAYEAYLAANREHFPPRAFALATAGWYYDARDHRCPHDAWFDQMRLEEPATGARSETRVVALRVRLLGAYHDGRIELYYPQVFSYELALRHGELGHRDWRYDEFRLSERGHLLHEIEWAGPRDTARWVIEASDVHFAWHPLGNALHPAP